MFGIKCASGKANKMNELCGKKSGAFPEVGRKCFLPTF